MDPIASTCHTEKRKTYTKERKIAIMIGLFDSMVTDERDATNPTLPSLLALVAPFHLAKFEQFVNLIVAAV
jgi:hypothetical protein